MAEDPEEESTAGSLLLAHPSLRDPNFHRSVVLMSSHDEQGAMGLVLNRPTGQTLGQVCADFALGPMAEVPMFAGGPVETDRLLLCAWRFHPEGSGFQLIVGIEPERALELHSEGNLQFRGFLGYAGWSAGQLESELRGNAWVRVPLLTNLLDLNADETLWKAILLAQDPVWKLFAEEPEDPELN